MCGSNSRRASRPATCRCWWGATLPIFAASYYADRDFAESSLEPPLTSGPYKVGKVEPGRSISYLRRDDYWGWDLPVNRGRFNFGEVVYEYFKDSTAAFEAFKAGVLRAA